MLNEIKVAIENKKLVEYKSLELQQSTCQKNCKIKELYNFEATISAIAEEIQDTFNETQIWERITRKLAQILQLDRCQIELYDSEQKQTTINCEFAVTNIWQNYRGKSQKVADCPEVYQQLLQKKSLQLIEIDSSDSLGETQVMLLVCPIFDSEEIIGNIRLIRSKEEIFTKNEIKLVQKVASQCANAIRQARLYQAAKVEAKQLEKLNALKDDFFKSISHELRNPMSSIQLAFETLETILEQENIVPKSPIYAEVLNIFRDAFERQNQTVSDLFAISKIDSQSESSTYESIEIDSLIREIVEPFIGQIHFQQQQIKLEIDPELPLFYTHVPTFKRILIELVNNACKYTPAGETITVSASATEECLHVSVTNSGVEIEPSQLERIFDKSYRIPNNDPWKRGGTGMGLGLIQKLTKLLGGSIKAESKDNRTSFTLQFSI